MIEADLKPKNKPAFTPKGAQSPLIGHFVGGKCLAVTHDSSTIPHRVQTYELEPVDDRDREAIIPAPLTERPQLDFQQKGG